MSFEPTDADQPVFVISVAAQLTGMHPQTLRGYDRIGLVSPGRAGGGGRRYSLRDIELLRTVAELTSSGIGIEGVRRVLELEHQVAALRARVGELQAELAAAHRSLVDALHPNLPVVRAGAALTRYDEQRSSIGPYTICLVARGHPVGPPGPLASIGRRAGTVRPCDQNSAIRRVPHHVATVAQPGARSD